MNIEELYDYCSAMPNTEDCMPFGDDNVVFKVNGKMFLLADLNQPFRFNIKAKPENVTEYIEQYEEAQPAFHMNKQHWLTVYPELSNDIERLKSWIDDSYQLVVSPPKKGSKKL